MRQHAQGCLQRPWFVVGLLTLALLHAPMTAAETQDVVVVNFDQAKEPVPHGWELSEKEGKADLAPVPLVIAGDIPGHEIELPLAVVVLGGLVTSTLLNLFIIPPLYLRFGKDSRSARALHQT